MKSKVFSKVLSTFFKSREIDGLIIYHDDEYTTFKEGFPFAEEFKVPLLKIKNPNNIPFSYNALKGLLEEDIQTIQSFAGTNYGGSVISKIIVFNNLDSGDYYFPEELENKLINCLNTDFIDISYIDFNTIYTINAKYVVDSDFEMVWEGWEELKVYLTLDVKHINVKNLVTNEVELIEDEEKIKRIVYDIIWRDAYTFEDPVWECFVKYVKPYKTFLDDQWQFVSLKIMVR
jgi:hypothetical protein